MRLLHPGSKGRRTTSHYLTKMASHGSKADTASSPGGSFITRQPGKALWLLFGIVSTSVRLPLWLLYNIPKSLRPHSKWSYRQAILNKIVKQLIYHTASIRIQTSTFLEPGDEKECFVVMQPAKDDLYRGVLKDAEIKPMAVGGTWYPSLFREGDSAQRIILHFHGETYVVGSGRKADSAYAAHLLVKHVAEKVFFPQYRLSARPGGRFPAALQDAVTSY